VGSGKARSLDSAVICMDRKVEPRVPVPMRSVRVPPKVFRVSPPRYLETVGW